MSKKFSIQAIFSAVDRLSAPMAKIRGKLGQFGKLGGKALGGSNRLVDKGFSVIGKASEAVGIAGIASLAGLGLALRDVMTQGMEFEKVLVRTGTAFETPVKLGTEGFAKLTAAARNVGKTTEFSALQGAEALNSLATAGYSVEQSIAALPKVINFASAAGLELSQASDIASDSLGAFSLRSADAATNAANMARVMDSMTRAAADSTTNTAELFEGIKMGGAFAATSGASIEQFVGLLGVLANKGIKGGEAGTAVRNSFLHLTKPTKEASAMIAHLGVKIAKTKSGAIDMTTTIGRFNKATAKMTATQKAAAIATIFGSYAVGPFLSLMDAGEDTIRKFTANIEGAAGVTEKMAETMRQSKAAKIARFFNIISDVKLTVFDAIAPTVLSIAESIGKWVTANQELIGTKAGEWAGKLRDALPGIWTWTVRLGKAFAVFAVFAATVKLVNAAVLTYEAITKLAAAATWVWNWATSASTIANAKNTLSIVASTVAAVASRIATLAVRAATLLAAAAQWAYDAPLNATLLATIAGTVASLASRAATLLVTAAQWALTAATGVATAAQTAYEAATLGGSGALVAFRVSAMAAVPAIGLTVTAMAPLVVTLGVALAAVLALVAAWQQFSALNSELSGSGGILGTISKMYDMGTFDPFKAHDAAMNEKAGAARTKTDMDDRDRAATDRAQMISPQDRAANAQAERERAGGSSTVDGTINIKTEAGAKASVKGLRGPLKIKTHPTGAFPA